MRDSVQTDARSLTKKDEVEQSPINVRTQLPSIASVLVVDSSGSMKNAMADTQRAAAMYIDNVRKEDEIAVIDFSDTVKVARKFTTDKQALRNAVRALKARGNTALYDAVFEASQGVTAPAKLKNVLAAENGGKLVYFTSQYDDAGFAARNLIDGKLGKDHEYATKVNTQGEVVFVLPQTTKIMQLAFNPFTSEDPSSWARDVEVEVSVEGPRQGFKSVGKFTLHNRQNVDPSQPPPDQVFKIDPVDAKFIKLRLLASHGGGYIEMGEFKAFAAGN